MAVGSSHAPTFFLASLLLAASFPACDAKSIVVGDIRVSALSSNLLRVEPKGPSGFEDDATFSIVGRASFAGLPLTQVNDTYLTTDHYSITLRPSKPVGCDDTIAADVTAPQRSASYALGATAQNAGACCALCQKDSTTKATWGKKAALFKQLKTIVIFAWRWQLRVAL